MPVAGRLAGHIDLMGELVRRRKRAQQTIATFAGLKCIFWSFAVIKSICGLESCGY